MAHGEGREPRINLEIEVNGNESILPEASAMITTNTTSNTIARIDRRLNIIYLTRLGQREIGERKM